MLFKLKTWAAALALALMAGAAPAALVLQANIVEVLDTDTSSVVVVQLATEC